MKHLSFLIVLMSCALSLSACKEDKPKRYDLSWSQISEEMAVAEDEILGVIKRVGVSETSKKTALVFKTELESDTAFFNEIKKLSEQGFLVYFIDSLDFLNRLNSKEKKCTQVASPVLDFLSRAEPDFDKQKKPVTLIGERRGASLAYAAVLQSEPGTFRSVFNLGECPVLQYKSPLCETERLRKTLESGANRFVQPGSLLVMWRKARKENEGDCKPEETDQFVKNILQTNVFYFEDEDTVLESINQLLPKEEK